MDLVNAAKMREIDKKAVEKGIPALVLMENAGRALARAAMGLARKTALGCLCGSDDVGLFHFGGSAEHERLGCRRLVSLNDHRHTALVLAGPGQNGGDGFVAARHLAAAEFRVVVLFYGDEEKLPPEAKANFAALHAYPVLVFRGEDLRDTSGLGQVDVVIDALLGTGQEGNARPPIGDGIKIAGELRKLGVPVAACDIPTGVDADTGRVFEPAITADVTVTMGYPKIGLYSYPGRAHAGRIVVENLGMPPRLLDGSKVKAFHLDDAKALMPSRAADHHKGMSGHVTVIAGSVGMAGAAVLAAKSALRAGAGTVTLLCPKDIYQVCASMAPEIMVLPCGNANDATNVAEATNVGGASNTGNLSHFNASTDTLDTIQSFIGRTSCFVVGPGFGRGDDQRGFLEALLPMISSAKTPCVLDADALHVLATIGGLSYLAKSEGKFILTPHPGELSSLTGATVRDIGLDRPGSAGQAALDSKSIVCLKGAGTCVANSSGDISINTSGDPAMATAGSGDVLAGVIASSVSCGLKLFDASRLGVFWHGLAGEIARREFGSHGALAGDFCDLLPKARAAIEGLAKPRTHVWEGA